MLEREPVEDGDGDREPELASDNVALGGPIDNTLAGGEGKMSAGLHLVLVEENEEEEEEVYPESDGCVECDVE